MKLLYVVIALFATACARQPKHHSQAKLLIRYIYSDGALNHWHSLRSRITSEEFAHGCLSRDPQLAATISKVEIQIPPDSHVATISVTASTPFESFLGIKKLMEAVTSAAHENSSFRAEVIQSPSFPPKSP